MQATGWIRGLLVLALAFWLTACGFHLRGINETLSFESLYMQGNGAPSIARNLRRALTSNGVKLVTSAEDAQIVLEMMSESYTKNILSLAGGGTVREYELVYNLTFRARDGKSEHWGAPQTVTLRRDFSYSDSALLAKEAEEARLNEDMRSEAVREVLRRMSSSSRGGAASAP